MNKLIILTVALVVMFFIKVNAQAEDAFPEGRVAPKEGDPNVARSIENESKKGFQLSVTQRPYALTPNESSDSTDCPLCGQDPLLQINVDGKGKSTGSDPNYNR